MLLLAWRDARLRSTRLWNCSHARANELAVGEHYFESAVHLWLRIFPHSVLTMKWSPYGV